MTSTIAVVIPNRNDAAYLRKCLDSVLALDVPPDQIIVVDDQSTDDSLEVMRQKLGGIEGAHIVVNPVCLGTMGALNEGLKHVTSDYVLFLSSNDYLEQGIFARAKSGIAAAGTPGVWSAMVWVVDEDGRHLHMYPSPVVSLHDAFLPPARCIRLAQTLGHWFTGTTLVYHRETLQAIGGFDTAYQGMGDMLAALTIASLKGAAFSPEPLGVMRQHAGGTMWRTMTNLPGLDAILARMMNTGPGQSRALFRPQFSDLMQRRVRFTALRTIPDKSWLAHAASWRGWRYRLLCRLVPLLGSHRKLQLAVAFMLLRPPFDAIAILWYRFLGRLFVLSRMRYQKARCPR